MINGSLSRKQLKALRREMKRAEMTQPQRQRFLWRVAKHGLIQLAKRNIRQQRTPEGQAWPARKRGKRKMLMGLGRLLAVKENKVDGSVTIYFKRGRYGRMHGGAVAYAQQHGTTVSMHATARGHTSYMATRAQARRLISLGYEVRRRESDANGKKKKAISKRATLSWITTNLSMQQAGMIIRRMKGRTPKQNWSITLPAREFLGASDDDFAAILARQLQGIQFGWNVKKQDIRTR
ncbi:MAG: hypothetical protein ACRC4K_02135 [Plesiomonas shigelloides]